MGTYKLDGNVFTEAWASEVISTGGSYARVAGNLTMPETAFHSWARISHVRPKWR